MVYIISKFPFIRKLLGVEQLQTNNNNNNNDLLTDSLSVKLH